MADEGPPHVVFSVVVQQDGITEVKNFRLRRGEAQAVKIGKGPANDVVVTHTGCSTQHAEIRLQDDDGIAPKLVVRDLSVNGTGVQRSGSTKTHGLEKDVDTPLEEGYLLFMPYRLKVKSTDPTSRVWLRVSRLKTHSSSASGSKRPREEQPDAQREEAATGRPLQAFAKRRSAPAGAVDGGSLEASDAKPSLQAHAKRRAAPPGGQAAQADGQEKPALVAYAKRRSAPHGTRRDADVEDGVANRAQSSSSRPVLRPAMRVVLTGLRAAPQLNGTGGLLEQFDEEANRWNVMLDGGDVKAVRAQNLLPEASAGKSQATGQQKSPSRRKSTSRRRRDESYDGERRDTRRGASNRKWSRTRSRSKSKSRSRSRSRRQSKSRSPIRRAAPRNAFTAGGDARGTRRGTSPRRGSTEAQAAWRSHPPRAGGPGGGGGGGERWPSQQAGGPGWGGYRPQQSWRSW